MYSLSPPFDNWLETVRDNLFIAWDRGVQRRLPGDDVSVPSTCTPWPTNNAEDQGLNGHGQLRTGPAKAKVAGFKYLCKMATVCGLGHATADRVVDVAAPGGAGCCKPNTARIALDKWALELSKTSSCPLTPTQRVQVAKRKRKEEEEDEKILLGPRQDEVTRVQLERATKEVVCESKCPQLWPTPPEVPITTIPTSTSDVGKSWGHSG